jgi:hypothetical protein
VDEDPARWWVAVEGELGVAERGGQFLEFAGVGGELDDVVSALIRVRGRLAAAGWAGGEGVLEVAVGVVEQQPDGAVGAVPGHRHGDGVGDDAVARDFPGAAVEAEDGGQSDAQRDPGHERHPPRLLRVRGGIAGARGGRGVGVGGAGAGLLVEPAPDRDVLSARRNGFPGPPGG